MLPSNQCCTIKTYHAIPYYLFHTHISDVSLSEFIHFLFEILPLRLQLTREQTSVLHDVRNTLQYNTMQYNLHRDSIESIAIDKLININALNK